MAGESIEKRLRRIVTADGPRGSGVLINAPPSVHLAGLFEIWRESLAMALDPLDGADRGPDAVVLTPPTGGVTVRWFIIEPHPPSVPDDELRAAVSRSFAKLDAADCLVPDGLDPTMHRTPSLDIVCLLSGSASLILDDDEILLAPGDVVVQRGTAHAWHAHGGPALFLAVLIDRRIASSNIDRESL